MEKKGKIETMIAQPSAEKSRSPETVKAPLFAVRQPQQMKELTLLLETITTLPGRVSENVGEDISGDLGASGASGASSAQGTAALSARDEAIAAMPSSPKILQEKLAKHIHGEVHTLSKQARTLSHARKPGSAFRLNELYARIRRLNALLTEILEASLDILRRLYIRVFVDKQPII